MAAIMASDCDMGRPAEVRWAEILANARACQTQIASSSSFRMTGKRVRYPELTGKTEERQSADAY